MKSSAPHIYVRSTPSFTPEQARDARAWAFVFACYQAKQNAASVTSTDGGDGTEIKGDSAYGRSIP